MKKWVCNLCNFRFNSSNPLNCPYCGREEGIEIEKNAEELLNEIEEILKK
jgi:hypothetical protein